MIGRSGATRSRSNGKASHTPYGTIRCVYSRLIDECGRGGRDLSAKEKDQPLFALASLRLSHLRDRYLYAIDLGRV